MNPITIIYLSVTALLGACWGSFLNVAYYRSAEGISLMTPPSHCPACKQPVPAWLNVPILGWFLTRGRCSGCKSPVSFHYPMIEAMTAIFFCCCFLFVPNPTAACLLGAVFSLYGLGAVYDHKKFQLPAVTLFGSMVLGLALVVIAPAAVDPKSQLTGLSLLLSHVMGGLLITGVLLAIKYIGQLFVVKTVDFNGRITVTQDGVQWEENKQEKECVTWDEFVFQKMVLKGNVRARMSGEAGAYQDGDVEIHDGYVTVLGQTVDLSQAAMVVECNSITFHRNAMGMGDILLVPSLGTLLGVNVGLFEMFLLASVTGTLHGLYLRRKDRRLPFGPHLMLATLYVILSRYGYVPAIMPLFQPK